MPAFYNSLTRAPEPFLLEGEDWFVLADERMLPWADVRAAVEREHQQLTLLVTNLESGAETSPLGAAERFNLVLGVTCHAIYHAGQIQLIRRLRLE